MKVVSVCSSDWANFAYQFSESLKTAGIDSYSYCLTSHVFDYPKQSELVSPDSLYDLTSDADFVILHHSCIELLALINKKNLIHYAAGTKYRQDHASINAALEPFITTTFIALPEFQQLTSNFHYVVGSVDINFLNPENTGRGCKYPVFGHFPSNPGVKGTNDIIRILNESGVSIVSSSERVGYSEQIERIKMCDIYVELLADQQGGKPYGSFGMTALEAAALGKIVITQNNNDEGLYNKTYGFNGLNFAKDQEKLKRHIATFSNYQEDYLRGQMKITRDWVVNNHSYEATGRRVKAILDGL